MAFSPGDRDHIMAFLGFPSTAEHAERFSALLETIDALNTATTTRVQGYVASLLSLETQIQTARNVGSQYPYVQLLNEGDRLVSLLAATLGVEVCYRVYRRD